jgi:hypothetical protein
MNSLNDLPAWQRKILREIKRDKKKTAFLAVLLVVALVVVIRATLSSSMPEPAAAATAILHSSDAPQAAVTVQPVGQAVDPNRQARRDAYLKQLDKTPKRDLFEPQDSVFPKKNSNALSTTYTGPITPNHAQTIETEARQLILQSTMLSAKPIAIINGKVLGIGDQYHDFSIVQINSRACLVEKEGVRITLEMKK